MEKINKRHHSDYIQISANLPKELVKNFKQLALEVDLGHSEAIEQAIRLWCETSIKKLNSDSDK